MDPLLILILALIGLVFAVIWLLLPFALFGIKPRLDQQTAELREIRAAIERTSAGAGQADQQPIPLRPPAERRWEYKAPLR